MFQTIQFMKHKFSLLFISFSLLSFAQAQKKPIDHTVYDNWKSISSPSISKSGNYIYYAIVPQEGDALAILKNNKNQSLLEIPRGSNLKLTDNEKFLISTIKAPFKEVREARIKKKRPDDMPKDSLLVFDILNNKTTKFPAVKSSQVARKANNYVAFMSEIVLPNPKKEDKADSTKKEEVKKEVIAAKDSTNNRRPSPKKEKTTPVLHVLNLNSGDTSQILKADNFYWSDNEQYLLFTRKGEGKDTLNEAGLYIYDLATKSSKKISNGKGTYKSFRFDDQNQQLGFLAEKSPEKALQKEYKLYYYTPKQDSAYIIADKNSSGMPEKWNVSGDGFINFSKAGNRLFFGLAPIARVRDTSLVDFETAKLDIWHWQDDYLQPMQLVNARRDMSRNYTALINLAGNRAILPLSDDTFNRISLTGDADNEWALATSDADYRIETQWSGGSKSDVYLVSILTGKNKLVIKNLSGMAMLSPTGTHVIYFNRENANWYSYDIQKESTTHLNEGLAISFVDEENDVPALPGPYGLAGWSNDFKNIYLNDRFDIWKLSLDGKHKSMLTKGKGRENQITYRYVDISRDDDPRKRATIIDEKKAIYLTGFNKTNKYNGYYKLDKKGPQEIWAGPFTYRMLSNSEKLDQVIYTKEDYQKSPDLYLLSNLKNETRLSDINPQQANYNWGTAELVKWKTPKGYEAEGILYKPENFDPNKKYPIIAYFYEVLSDGLYTYQPPAPTPSRLNIPYFVSNEYLVFAPDIRYETGYPGRSAEEYINSGMHYLARNNAWVDSTKMGIQGQSWGGYQVAHLITRTNMYAAAWAGAPVVNMTSAYGGIRWGTGMSRQFQYENTQSRIGKPLWEALDLYIENSPLFFMDKVNTPVAIMHNDNDGAVPWYQGIEFFTALRRLNKPVWLLNYNGDDHNLIQRQNRKDIQIREAQFFDHFLKGKPAANWIKKGVKATEKGIDWGLEVD